MLGAIPRAPQFVTDRMERELHIDGGLLRAITTGGLFLFEWEDVPPRNSEMFGSPTAVEHLPPLPFAKIWIELRDMRVPFRDLDGRESVLLGFGVSETEPAAEWEVFLAMIDLDNLRLLAKARPDISEAVNGASIVTHQVTLAVESDRVKVGLCDDDLAEIEKGSVSDDDRQLVLNLCGLPEYLVQLIHVSGAVARPVSVPQADLRRFERNHGVEHPSVYRIDLRGAGEGPSLGAVGGRQYHHRWLVRGHYRREDSGRFDVPGKGRCTWVKPHVKGPVGAPWKGRAVYTV